MAKCVTAWRIYALKDPAHLNVRYIGWTTKTIDARLHIHIYEARQTQKNRRHKWIRSLLNKGYIPLAEVIEEGSGDGWAAAEKRWIDHYRSIGADLVNGTNGGEGVIGWGTPDEQAARTRKRMVNTDWEKHKISILKWHAGRTYEQRSIAVRKGWSRLTTEEWRARSVKLAASQTLEQRSAARVKGWANMTPERRAQVCKAISLSIPVERRREIGRRSILGFTTEQLSDISRKRYAAQTPEWKENFHRCGGIAANAKLTSEQLCARNRKAGRLGGAVLRNSRTPEERSANSSRIVGVLHGRRTPEQRSLYAQIAGKVGGRARIDAMASEDLSEWGRRMNNLRTPEERSALARKAVLSKTTEQRREAGKKAYATKMARLALSENHSS